MNRFARSSGVLMNVSSLPSEFGIGCFSSDVDTFVDMILDMGFHWWQVLPITVIGAGNSPYSGISTYAGNSLYISPVELMKKGLIEERELSLFKYTGSPYKTDYDFAKENSERYIRLAFSRIDKKIKKDIAVFAEKQKHWIYDYALFMSLSKIHTSEWWTWESGLKHRNPEALKLANIKHKSEIEYYIYEQFEFFNQWYKVKQKANSRGIRIIGDLSFYVSIDSVDVWANSSEFQLNKDLRPNAIAGVPPDSFSEIGQVWGNCLYDFDVMKANNFSWWRKRIGHCLEMYDALRLDHFLAFYNYFSIPYGDETAVNGHWEKGPKDELLNLVKKDNPKAMFIAEDLGHIDDDCRDYITSTEFPTMRVFQFGFDGSKNIHLPYMYEQNNVVYTGTHDNNTTLGWLYEMSEFTRNFALRYSGFEGSGWGCGGPSCESTKAIIKTILATSADLVIVPIQDMLGYGSDTRMNIPGVALDNWTFRLPFELMLSTDRDFFFKTNKLYGRLSTGVK